MKAVDSPEYRRGYKFSAYLRHLVDPPGDHPLDRRSGLHDPYPRVHMIEDTINKLVCTGCQFLHHETGCEATP
jgi:hypothetical protein